jgi:hypothetical protein
MITPQFVDMDKNKIVLTDVIVDTTKFVPVTCSGYRRKDRLIQKLSLYSVAAKKKIKTVQLA